ncbi:invasin domain 3-containing protein, partial [Daejeonella sp.]|uniref:invasin domain 3-containing protein n=1 Tax=Daejeonella sp. TaxID=2805397 RepID=UPI0025BB75E6
MFFRKLKLVFILFIGFFIKSLVVNAQCDPNQKYDKIVSGYHQSIALKQSGIFSVWGQDLSSSGTGDILSPIDLISSNYSALTGTVLKVSIGGEGGTGREQAIALTTDGLFAWGTEGKVLSNALTTSAAFQKIQTPTNGDASTKLPTGVSPSDVSMIQASNQTLAILTNSGNVWMLTQASLALEGNGGSVSTSGSSSWKKVKTSSTTDLTNVIAIRGQVSSVSLNAFAALTSSGDLYTWGSSVYLGNNTASTSASYATLMTLPVEFTSSNVPKMIGVTGGFKTSSTLKNTYYILSSNGSLYALGDNSKRQCGDFTTSERRTWVNSKINSSTNFNNVNTISVQEHDASFPGISAITFTGDLYTWGENDGLMLGRQTEGADYDPGLPGGFVSGTDKAIFAELGGHTLVYIKEGSSQFCYVGHKVAGSMGDGSSTDTNINTFDCSNTPNLEICGSVPVVASTANSTISANPTSITADGNSTSTITIQLKDASGNNLTTSGGVVVVTTSQGSLGQVVDNNNGTYTVLLTSSSNTGTATINFKINGNNATNSTTVAFSQAPNCSPNVLFKLSPPNVSTSAIQGQVGTKTENFNSFADEVVPASGAYAIGNFVKTGTALRTSHKTDAIYGAPLPNSTTSSRYLGVFSGNVVNVTLTEPSKYLGFWWAGGDAENQVTIFGTCGGNEIQLAQFTTSAVTSLLSNPTITAIDGNVYNSVDYIRGTPFAYINLQLDNPSISFTRLEFTQRSGEGGFEVDNITTGTGYGAASNTTPSAPTITSISPTETSLTVNFTAPTSDGGSPITNYEYTTDGGTTWTAFSPTVTSSPVTITGLVSGTNYPVKLRAVNAIGSGAPSNTLTAATVSTLDSDGDGITDVNDPDDDGDGIIDGLEQDCSASTGVSESLNPSPFYFVQWNSFANGVLSGVINVPGETINVTVTNSSNSILLQNDDPFGGTSDWAPLPSGNASLSTFRSLTLGEHKFVFDKPVNNPRFFINSLNKTLDLSLPGKILKSNGNFAGAPVGTTTQVLVGNEGTGTISFAGNITQISFTGRESELYCNFSLGISGLSDFSTCLDIDTDLDGTPDRLDLDSDGDGVTDAQEIIDGTSPTDLCSFVLINQTLPPTATWETTDCDNDGFDNKTEVDRGSDPLVANAAPTNILLSPSTINENVAANATIGAFSTSDLDVGNTFTYTLVSGTGATDNGAVNISGSNLRITASPDFET